MNGSSTGNMDIWGEIQNLAQENEMIDAVLSGKALMSTLDALPGFDAQLPPGAGSAADAGEAFLESLRNQNEQLVDQLLPSTNSGTGSGPSSDNC
jgi:hypothetical protein